MSQTYLRVIAVDDVPENGNAAVTAFGRSILICRSQGVFYAVANECTHQRQPLLGGRIRGTSLFCPVHGARFDLRTGAASGALTQQPLRTYEVQVQEGWVEIRDATTAVAPASVCTAQSPGCE